MSQWPAFGGLAGLVLCIACLPAKNSTLSKPKQAIENSSVTHSLTCTASISIGRLVLEVELENSSSEAVWVAHALPELRGAAIKMRPTAFVYRNETQEVVISRRVFRVPENIEVAFPIVPEWSLLKPQERLLTHAIVPWPLRQRLPYTKEEIDLGTPATVTLELSVVSAKSDIQTTPLYSEDLINKQTVLRTKTQVPQTAN